MPFTAAHTDLRRVVNLFGGVEVVLLEGQTGRAGGRLSSAAHAAERRVGMPCRGNDDYLPCGPKELSKGCMNHKAEMRPAEGPADIYERRMVPAMLASWVPALLDLVALTGGER